MKVVLSSRVEAELVRHFESGVARFGHRVAERTFNRIRTFLFVTLPENPMIGRYLADRNIFKHTIARTPFVVFYRVDNDADQIIVIAIFYGSQDRREFDVDD